MLNPESIMQMLLEIAHKKIILALVIDHPINCQCNSRSIQRSDMQIINAIYVQ